MMPSHCNRNTTLTTWVHCTWRMLSVQMNKLKEVDKALLGESSMRLPAPMQTDYTQQGCLPVQMSELKEVDTALRREYSTQQFTVHDADLPHIKQTCYTQGCLSVQMSELKEVDKALRGEYSMQQPAPMQTWVRYP